MTRYRYPYIKNSADWKNIVDNEFYQESRLKGRRLTESEKKAVVRSIKRDLEIKDSSVGLGRKNLRYGRLSVDNREDFGLSPRKKVLGSINCFDDFYIDYLDYVHHHFEDVNILVPSHHRKNLKNLLLRISSDQLRTLIDQVFNFTPETKSVMRDRKLWDELNILCSINYNVFFYTISLCYLKLFLELDVSKYVVYDVSYGINSYDLNFMCNSYGSVFMNFIKHIDFQHHSDRDPPTDILVLLKITENPRFSSVIESERKVELVKSAHLCFNRIVDSLVSYGLKENSIRSLISMSKYEELVNLKPLKDVLYFSDFLLESDFEAKVNQICNNIRLSKEPVGLGKKQHASTLLNYVSIDFDILSAYNGKSDVTITHSFISYLIPSLDSSISKSSPSGKTVSFGLPVLRSPEGVSFLSSGQNSPNDNGSIVYSPFLPVPYDDSSDNVTLKLPRFGTFTGGRRSR